MGTTTTGDGTWDTTTANWFNGTTDVVWPNSGTDVAQFGNTTALNGGATEIAGTATTAAAIQVNQIVFTLAGYTIANGTGGSLTLSGTTPTINSTVTTGVDTISAVIGGAAGLTKTGVGTVVLSGANTYTGTTTINGGTLQLSGAGAFGPTSGTVTASTVAITGTSTLNLGGTTRTLDNVTLAQTAAITGMVTNGSLDLTGANNFAALGPGSAATSTEDLSGLTSFTYAQNATGRTFNVGVGSNAASNLVLNLSNGTNTITATNLNVGNGGGQTVTGGAATMNLGVTNVINSDNIVVGGYRSTSGTVQFNTGLTGTPTLTLRGAAGGTTPVADISVGLVQSGGAAQTGVLNATGGTLNAIANTVSVYIVGTATPNGSANNTSNVGTFSFTNGTANVGTLNLGGTSLTAASSAATVVSTLNQNAGALLADTVIFGNNSNAAAGTTSAVAGVAQANLNHQSAYNLGSTATPGVLSAGAMNLSALASSATSRFTVNFNNGTITNYDNTANGFSGQGNANGSTTTNVQNLTIAGRTGGGTAVDANTLNIVLAGTGTHNFLAESGSSITQTSTSLITGNGVLTINGAGTVSLGGANTYSGGTTLSAGKTILANATGSSATGTGAVALSGGTTTTLSGAGFSTGLLTVTAASRIAPGVNVSGANTNFGTPATLSLGTTGGMTLTSASVDFDLSTTAGGTNDKIATGGTLTLGTLAFAFNETGGTLDTTTAYQLITGATGTSGFSAGNITTTFVGGTNYTPAYSLNGNALQVTFAAVPEPSTWALMAGGFCLMAVFRRRQSC